MTQHLVLEWSTSGVRTVGEAIARLESMDPAVRRQLLNRLRVDCGLPSIEDVEHRRGVEVMRRRSSFPVGATCGEPDCVNMSTRFGGVYVPLVRRWRCPQHEHLAEPGDLEPRVSGLKYTDLGTIVAVDPDDDDREQDRAEHEAIQRAERDRERQVEAAAYRSWVEARDAGQDAELPPHLRRSRT